MAREVGINLLGSARALLGSLDKVKRVVKVLGMVNSAEGFGDQPKVINGFSDLMVEVFGENGRHARSAVGMAELPMGIPVEIEMILEVDAAAAPTARKPRGPRSAAAGEARSAAAEASSGGRTRSASAIRGPYQDSELAVHQVDAAVPHRGQVRDTASKSATWARRNR